MTPLGLMAVTATRGLGQSHARAGLGRRNALVLLVPLHIPGLGLDYSTNIMITGE